MGRKALSLDGKTFGFLKVLERVHKPDNTHHSFWLCECLNCGSKKVVTGTALTSGKTISCGCINDANRREVKDLTGKHFGRLKVIRKTDKRKNGKIVWECLCKCGNTCEVTASRLGVNTNSCGCIKVEENRKDCVEETRLRMLTAKKPQNRKNKDSGVKGVIWDKRRRKWMAQIQFKGKRYYLGRYDTVDEAEAARKEAEKTLFKPILKKYNKE